MGLKKNLVGNTIDKDDVYIRVGCGRTTKTQSYVINNILAIYAMSGCDTVSALAGIGKKRLIKSAVKDLEMSADSQAFMSPDDDNDSLFTSEQGIISKLYLSGKKKNEAFDQLRIM